MKVLCISCTAKELGISVASIDATKRIEQYIHWQRDEKQGHHLVDQLATRFSQIDLTMQEIDLIICPKGPGSFTSLRTAMTVAKGLAFAESIPIVAVPNVIACCQFRAEWEGLVIPIIDARTSRFFSVFARNAMLLCDCMDLHVKQLLTMCKEYRRKGEKILLSGRDAGLVFQEFSAEFGADCILDTTYPALSLYALLQYGIQLWDRKEFLADDAGPVYIRPATIDKLGAQRRSKQIDA